MRELALVHSNQQEWRRNVLRWHQVALAFEQVPQTEKSMNRAEKPPVFLKASRSHSCEGRVVAVSQGNQVKKNVTPSLRTLGG